MVMFFKNDTIGTSGLGEIMTLKFIESALINAKEDSAFLPQYIICVNRGVLLCTDNSNLSEKVDNSLLIPHLKELQNLGSKIICCGTCIEYFGLQNRLLVGEVGNAKDIMRILSSNQILSL